MSDSRALRRLNIVIALLVLLLAILLAPVVLPFVTHVGQLVPIAGIIGLWLFLPLLLVAPPFLWAVKGGTGE